MLDRGKNRAYVLIHQDVGVTGYRLSDGEEVVWGARRGAMP
jgi:hypothetical protein